MIRMANKAKASAKVGRPTNYTEALGDAICKKVSEGLSLRLAAGAVGVPHQTAHSWCDTHPGFSDKLARARADRAERYVGKIEEADARDVPRWQWLLERLEPRDYGNKAELRQEISGPGGAPIVVQVSESATPEEVARAVAVALGGVAEGGAE